MLTPTNSYRLSVNLKQACFLNTKRFKVICGLVNKTFSNKDIVMNIEFDEVITLNISDDTLEIAASNMQRGPTATNCGCG